VWVVPGLAIMLAAAGLCAGKDKRAGAFVLSVALVGGAFAATQAVFRAVNWWVYGTFVGVDFKETNYQRALAALTSVRAGEVKPFVSVSRDAMRSIGQVSPAFASLAPYFEMHRWEKPCLDRPSICGEIPAGWFVWALRDAAQTNGHYTSPEAASSFFGQIADEIEAACARGEFECKSHLIAEMPAVGWREIAAGLAKHWPSAYEAALRPNLPRQLIGTSGSPESVKAAVRFLNHPLHRRARLSEPDLAPYSISGWYYRVGADWISVSLRRRDGASADIQLERRPSGDIARHFNDGDAGRQRFAIEARCNDDCVLTARTPEAEAISRTFAELSHAPIGVPLGQGTFYVDQVSVAGDISGGPTLAESVASRLRSGTFNLYDYTYIPVLALGALSFLFSSVRYWRDAIWNICYVMALVCWTLAVARIGLLLLITATSFHAFGLQYVAPTYFILICAAVLSCAALLQLSGWLPAKASRGEEP
jgi:hypothetical protein